MASGDAYTPVKSTAKSGGGWREVFSRSEISSLVTLCVGASSSRVLNLMTLAERNGHLTDYARRPFFQTAQLNRSIVVRHRVAEHEKSFFDSEVNWAAKVIIPINMEDLTLGGMTVLIGEKEWGRKLKSHINEFSESSRDATVLKAMLDAPSLDPFVLRQILARRSIDIADCYFQFGENDIATLRKYVTREIKTLTETEEFLRMVDGTNADRLAEALLADSRKGNAIALGSGFQLTPQQFQDGVFGWRGFLYYKCRFITLAPEIASFINEIQAIRIVGFTDDYNIEVFKRIIRSTIRIITRANREIIAKIKYYDHCYNHFMKTNSGDEFSKFLIGAPAHFIRMGELVGIIADIVTYWRCRFPEDQDLTLQGDQAFNFLSDIESSLAATQQVRRAPVDLDLDLQLNDA